MKRRAILGLLVLPHSFAGVATFAAVPLALWFTRLFAPPIHPALVWIGIPLMMLQGFLLIAAVLQVPWLRRAVQLGCVVLVPCWGGFAAFVVFQALPGAAPRGSMKRSS